MCRVIRAVIYTRVSQDRGAGKRSVGEQEAECRTLATGNGWTVVRVFPDNDRSASRYAKKLWDFRAAELTADHLGRPIRIDPGDQGFVVGRLVRIQHRQAGTQRATRG